MDLITTVTQISSTTTWYDPMDAEQCGKSANDPNLGMGAAGEMVVAGQGAAVDERVIPLGSMLYIDNWGWVKANDTGNKEYVTGTRIDVAASEEIPYPGTLYDVAVWVYPPGTACDMTRTPDGGPLPKKGVGYTGRIGAGKTTSRNTSTPKGIMKFAGFIGSLAFQESLKSGFEQSSEYSLHQFLAGFMSKFYHNIYYVPTLPNNKCIIVKPETMFVDPPSCNIIYPSIRTSGGFSMNYKSQPTRILMISDPVAKLFGASEGVKSDLSNVVTLAYMDYADSSKTTLTVKGLKQLSGDTAKLSKPMGMISGLEEDIGVRIVKTSKGADIFLFLMSESGEQKTGGTNAKVINKSGRNLKDIGDVLFKLASYELQRARYTCKPGSYATYFNPYIVPGFPMLNIEQEDPNSDLSVHAYVTDVTHQITDDGWSTNITTSATHRLPDPKPEAFPIVEQEYTETLNQTYVDMLGPSVHKVEYDTAIHKAAADFGTSGKTATEAYKSIWRPLTTMAEHLVTVCDGATPVVDANGILTCQGSFFRTDVQSTLINYATRIKNGMAYNPDDVY